MCVCECGCMCVGVTLRIQNIEFAHHKNVIVMDMILYFYHQKNIYIYTISTRITISNFQFNIVK